MDYSEKKFRSNGETLQSVINDDLFPNVQNVSDVKQVLEVMKDTAQNLREPQMKALILLEKMGNNKYLHGERNPYEGIIKYIREKGKIDVANPDYYLDTIEALIPKPPKPIIMAEKGFKK